jgi:prepilin-type N-terminal cleavage/methylation domain-containing protein
LRSAAKRGGMCASQAGFTLTELLVVVSIIGIVVGLSLPNLARSIDNAKLNGATQKLAAVYQDARLRAAQNNSIYEIVVSPPGVTPARICIDLDANRVCGNGDPVTVFPTHISLSGGGVPGLTTAQLGFSPSDLDPALGTGWNGLGIPCQRSSAASPCAAIGWVQYLQLQRSGGDMLFSAVTVSPTGRIKIWTYRPSENGNGTWF